MPSKPNIKFVLSVDTEEEWDWSGPFPQQDFAVENIKKIPVFQQFCHQLGIKPTYFVDYAVANDPISVDILKRPLDEKQCEIAAHLHPWCNPPYYGETGERESHVVNLPIEQVKQKLSTLTKKLTSEFGVEPKAFRTGRWGVNGEILELLVDNGYTIDSSIYPYYQHKYFTCQGAPNTAYWPSFTDALSEGKQRRLLQLPVTVGFSNSHFHLSNRIHQILESSKLKWLRPVGVAWHLGLLKKLYMSPELSSANEMILLANKALKSGQTTIHMYLHSSSLLSGATGFIDGDKPCEAICHDIKAVVDYLKAHTNLQCCTISEAADEQFLAEQASNNTERVRSKDLA